MANKRKICIVLLAVTALLAGIQAVYLVRADRTAPVITVQKTEEVYRKGMSDEELLAGVTAVDDRDGNCTSALRVNHIYFFDDGERCVVEYVVKDRRNNLATLQVPMKCKT